MTAQTKWELWGDYFENCNCAEVCPCLFSPDAPETERPSQDVCDVAFAFHIDKGRYGDVSLDGLNVVIIAHMSVPVGEGNWTVAAYIEERADDGQTRALEAIFSGAQGGPMSVLAPLFGKHLGMKKVAIKYVVTGKNRSVEIPNIMQMAVEPLCSTHPRGEIWTKTGHPLAPDRLGLAVGSSGSTFADHGMSWDNSGKNGHYASIHWTN
jgi:hypothetical protein